MIEFNCHNFERLTSAQQKALCTMIQLAFEHFSKHPEGPDSRASRCPLQAVVQPSDSEAVNREAGQMKRTVQPRVGEPAKSRRGIPMREALRILLKEMNGGEPARLNPAVRGRESASVPCTGVVRPEIQKETDNGK